MTAAILDIFQICNGTYFETSNLKLWLHCIHIHMLFESDEHWTGETNGNKKVSVYSQTKSIWENCTQTFLERTKWQKKKIIDRHLLEIVYSGNEKKYWAFLKSNSVNIRTNINAFQVSNWSFDFLFSYIYNLPIISNAGSHKCDPFRSPNWIQGKWRKKSENRSNITVA